MINPKIISQSDNQIEFEVSLDEAYIKPHKSHVIDHMRGGVKAPGFRPGKAPDHIVEQQLGARQVQGKVMQDVVMHSYGEVIEELKLETIAEPQISLMKFVPYTELAYKVTVALMPKLDLPDFSKIKVPFEADPVTDEELEKALEEIITSAAERKEVKRAARSGDEVTIDYRGERKGKEVEGAVAQNQTLKLGEGKFIPGFEDNIVGMKPGEEKTFEVTFPKEYHAKDLAGVKVNFTITLHKVSEVSLPERDESLAKKLGGFADFEALKADVKKYLAQGKENQAEGKYKDAVLEAVIKQAKVDVPDGLASQQVEQLRGQMRHEFEHAGMDEQKYLESIKKTQADYDKELADEAARRIKLGMILRQIIADNNIKVADEEVEGRLTQMKLQYASDEETQKQLARPEFATDLADRMLSEKAMDFIVDKVRGNK